MTFSENPSSSFSRAAVLLQRYFDRSLTLEEAYELKRYWEANPEFQLFAERNQEIHRFLAFFSTLEDFSISGVLGTGGESDQETDLDGEKHVSFTSPIALFADDSSAGKREPEAPPLEKSPEIDESVFRNPVQTAPIQPAGDSPSLPPDQDRGPRRSIFRCKFGRKRNPDEKRSPRRLFLPILIVLPFVVAVGVLAEFHWHRDVEPPRRVVAHLVEMERAVWENPGKSPKKGDAVQNGTLKLLDGLISLKMIDGAELILEGPAEIELKTASEVKIVSGYLSVDAPPQPTPLSIETCNMKVDVFGTAFWIRADQSKSEIHMLQGEVELSNSSFGRLQLGANEAFSILQDGISKRFDALDRLFLTRTRFPERSTELGQSRLRQWKENSESLNARRDLAVRFDFEEIVDSRLPNLTGSGKTKLDQADIAGARSAEGRWPQKRALRCDGQTEHVHFELPGPMDSLTIFVSLCIDSLDNDFNGILVSDEGNTAAEQGLLHWQITRYGAFRFGVAAPGSNVLVSSVTPKILGENNLGQWLRLAVTVDSSTGRVHHYVNGQCVFEESVRMDFKPEIGSASLGFRRETNENKPRRGLCGAFDELMIFDRALSDKEIRKLSE